MKNGRRASTEKQIGAYKLLTPLKTAGSGSARWAIALRGGERFFLKEFLSPVYPPAGGNEQLRKKQIERCRRFEARKQRLYSAMSCVIGDTLVPVLDFFRYDGRYYSISEEIVHPEREEHPVLGMSQQEKRQMLLSVAQCLQRLHMQDIVHADLKPEHVLASRTPFGYEARLIDLDSGFLEGEIPESREMEGDPVYLAPEAFLRMTGQDAKPGKGIDTFAFGAMIHYFWTGSLPGMEPKCSYLYEAALTGSPLRISRTLPGKYRELVGRMLSKSPEDRPGDAEIVRILTEECESGGQQSAGAAKGGKEEKPLNGLSRFMKNNPV